MTATLNDVRRRSRLKSRLRLRPRRSSFGWRRSRGCRSPTRTGCSNSSPSLLETSLNEEMTEHLGHEKHDPAGAGPGNIRNGTRSKTVLTEHSGPVEIDVPRDRTGAFEPKSGATGNDACPGSTWSCFALCQGLTTGEISAHFAEIYGASVGKETISRITRQGHRGR